ncbi:hypothetical protein RFI_29048 [Reticulomyxa filosa]|uniref:Uncharacterized protein n=1 Tax=Reticulomyxa filosa TaxID=46433 RepID=X6M4E9_RETFI|nr:hypothetical protein RFI_29048 [Reticulomyxa filosa]|eukprot:ETO08342.1 hypothetical protein RFI_29048 [Reticulomyxa filosa]
MLMKRIIITQGQHMLIQQRQSVYTKIGHLIDPNLTIHTLLCVVPLCDAMKEYVWPFGQLSALNEKQYIRTTTKQTKDKFNNNAVIYKKIQQWELKII